MLKKQATVLVFVCAGSAASPCFSSNSLDQLCKQLRNTSTPGSRVVRAHVPKAPASHLCRTVLPPSPDCPVQHPLSSCRSPQAVECCCQQGKIACLAPFWPAVPISQANSILTFKSARLQPAWFETRSSLVGQTDLLLFCPWPNPEEWPLSFPAACPGSPQPPPVPFHLHGNAPYPMMQHISAHNEVIGSFPSWKDRCHMMGEHLVLPLTSGCFTWGKKQGKKS